jgi:3-polyprenyl-4-hydroxybenzoate decarboxylase
MRSKTCLIISRWGKLALANELDKAADDLIALADHDHNFNDLTASIASGSFPTAE